jgi:hypothetical protein
MYAENVIIERLALAKKSLGWIPERHSIDEVIKFTQSIKHLEYYRNNTLFVNSDALTPMQNDFIRNEVAVCACDADYWLTRYGFVRDETNTITRFKWRVPQKVAFSIIADMEAGRHSIEIQWLKGRQLGVSTIIELLITHRILFGYGINAVAASIDETKSAKMAEMMFLAVENCPWWIKPTEHQKKLGKFLSFYNKCSVTIQSGKQMSGISRGSTPTVIHLSELSEYPNPQDLVEASLFRAVHPSPKVFMNLESTGNSNVGWWAETWRYNKANWHKGKARLRPVFLPWFMGTDIYPMPTWLHDHPVPSDWQPCAETQSHAAVCNAFVKNTDYLNKELGSEWRLPRVQAWFWEVNYLEHKAKRIERQWTQEMPADDYQALASKQEKVFSYEVICRIEEERPKAKENAYEVYAIVGEGIEDEFHPIDTDVDYDKPRIPIVYNNRDKSYRWQLIPLVNSGIESEETRKWNNALIVYEKPKEGARYSAAADTGSGGGQDRTVVSVTRVEQGRTQDVQAAELCSDQINSAEATYFVIAICAYYNVSIFAAEQVRKSGDTCQNQMRLMGWPNAKVHSMVRYDGKRVQKSRALKKGWYTHGWSRNMLLDNYVAAVEGGWYKVNSTFLKQELENFERKTTESGKTKAEHMSGKHDDRLFASAISYFIAHDMDAIVERSKRRYTPPESKLPELVSEPCVLNVVTFRQIWGTKFPGSNIRLGG